MVLDARQESDRVTVTLDGQVFGVFHFEADRAKPIIWPLIGPDGIGLTRNWPMSEDDPDDSRDHVHQQSFWVAHGDVNGGKQPAEATPPPGATTAGCSRARRSVSPSSTIQPISATLRPGTCGRTG